MVIEYDGVFKRTMLRVIGDETLVVMGKRMQLAELFLEFRLWAYNGCDHVKPIPLHNILVCQPFN